MKPRLFVVSGPSGVGKGTMVARVREQLPGLGLTVSATTRGPRPGETEGKDYYYVSDERFDQLVRDGAFVEWAQNARYRYGTLVSEVERNLSEGRSLILEIDVQGGFNVKRLFPDATLVFVEPPSTEELEARLRGRGTEDEADIEARLAKAKDELAVAPRYDVRIVNDDLEQATDELLALLEATEN